MTKPVPKDIESVFHSNELFFSTTDARGVIESGNDVFIRVSKYSKEKLLGAPHSIIRHPDMPRSVFKLLWDTIQAGRPIVAYVKNLAADGSYYWVQAYVFPLKEGYLSIRLKPTSAFLKAVQGIYADVLEYERSHELAESCGYLGSKVLGAGFSSYTDFMVKSALSELRTVEHEMSQKEANAEGQLRRIMSISRETTKDLKSCADSIERFQTSNQTFTSVMGKLTDAFINLKFVALNMTVSSGKYGEKVAGLGVVAREFSDLSEQIQNQLASLGKFMGELKEIIVECGVRIVSLEVQMLMVNFFVTESIRKMHQSEHAFEEMLTQQSNFSELFKEHARELEVAMSSLKNRLGSLETEMASIRKFITGLTVIRQVGAVESARDVDVRATFAHYLDEMLTFITLLQDSTSEINRELGGMSLHSELIVKCAHNVAGNVDDVFAQALKMDSKPV